MVSNRISQHYDTNSITSGQSGSLDVTKSIVRDITPEIRRSASDDLDIAIEMHEYETTEAEGKYTHGLYTKITIVGREEHEAEQDISDDAILEIIEQHLVNLNREVVELHQSVQETLAEMKALEKE